MPRYRLNHAAVVDGAADLVNADGANALSLAELAARFRVRTPSLYNHIEGLEGLRRDLAIKALRGLNDKLGFAIAGLAGKDALLALADAYRTWAQQNPGLYAFLLRPIDGDENEPDEDELKNAANDLQSLLLAALRGYQLNDEATIHSVRILRSALHGFVSLELAGGFGTPESVNQSWSRLLAMLDRDLNT